MLTICYNKSKKGEKPIHARDISNLLSRETAHLEELAEDLDTILIISEDSLIDQYIDYMNIIGLRNFCKSIVETRKLNEVI